MATAVVLATIVNTNMSVADFHRHVVEQLRDNDRSLMDKLADADDDAKVVTAVLNVDEFLAYMVRRFPHAVDTAIVTNDQPEPAAVELAQPVDTSKMSEGEFMDYILMQLESGAIEPMVHFPDDYWEEDEAIGEDISQHPFLY